VTEQIPGVPGELAAGSYVAGYRIEERIGQGGMAAVFRAYDQQLDRLVALKVLAPALANDEAFRQRFIRESRAAAAVDDPHIIPVFAAGESQGVLFIAMRLVRGGDVRSLIDRIGPLPAARAAEIISQTASALDAAHARGLVHRDVKPANMLLEASQTAGRPDHVYLSDFGLTKASLAVTGLTSTGQFLGTLDYIAPEQIEGRPVDGRTDQYALACAAFELLSGEPPFRRPDSVAVMYAQLHEPPPALRLRRPELPGGIDEIMARALAKTPADRFVSCRDFAAALGLVLGLGAASRESSPRDAHPRTEIAGPVAPGPVAPARPARSAGPAAGDPAQVGAGHTQAAGYSAAEPPAAAEPAAAEPPAAAAPSAAPAAQPTLAPSPGTRSEQAAPEPAWPATAQQTGQTAPVSAAAPDDYAHLWRGDGPGAGQAAFAGGPAAPLASRRSWLRSPLLVGGVCVVVLLAGGVAYALSRHGHGPGLGSKDAGKGIPASSLSLPGCTTRTAQATTTTSVTSAKVSTGGNPFGVAVTPDGKYSFVSTGNAVQVLRDTGALAPALVRAITVRHVGKGLTLTPDGQFLLAAEGSGAVVINVAEAVEGAADPVFGTLTSPSGSGAFDVLISADRDFAFVTLQNSAKMAVYNLRAALTQGISASDFIGYVPLGTQPVGMSSDGTWLYVANLGGTLSIVNLRKAEQDPAHSVFATAPAGCGTARTLLSADDSVLWVTARQSDELLAFSTLRLRTSPRHALVARVMVGEAPLGEALVDGGAKIVIADSNLNGLTGAMANLAVVDVARALAGKPALLGYVATGLLPRAVAAEPGGMTLLVSDQKSGELQALRIADLP
jgi:DNA-binding beta-propeller fold protein YncE